MATSGTSTGLRAGDRVPVLPPDEPRTAVTTQGPPGLGEYFSSARGVVVGTALAVVAMFVPVVAISYAFTDDYPVLAITNGLGPNHWFGKSIVNTTAAGGRPFAGLLDQLFFSVAGTIDNLRFIRLAALIGIVALALLLEWALVRSGTKPVVAALIAVLVCSLPAFQVYASWGVLFNVPYAALLGGTASLLLLSILDAPAELLVDRLIGAVGALLAALLIYQPAAMFFWVFLAVGLVGTAASGPRSTRLIKLHLAVAAVALAVAFVVQKLALHFVGNSVPNRARTELTHNIPGKIGWFFKEPLYKSLNLFDLTPSPWLTAFVAAVALVGIVLLLRRRSASPLLHFGVAALLIPLCYLPNLVVKENFSSYRSQGSLSSLMALYFALGAVGIWLTLRDRLRPRIEARRLVSADRLALLTSAAFVTASAFIAVRNVTTLIAVPQNIELRQIRSKVAALPPGTERLAFVPTAYFWGPSKFVVIDEFGLPSTSQLWSLEASVDLILREEGRLGPTQPRPTIDLLPWDVKTLPENEPVIDLRSMQYLR